MSLKLFKLTWPDADWDCYNEKLIVCEKEELAFEKSGSWNCLGADEPSQNEIEIECIGIPDSRYKDGDIVMTDLQRG